MSGPALSDHRIQLASPDGAFSVTVAATGARVSSIVHTATGTEFLVRTPWADEEWSGTYPSGSSNKEWHRRYAGGWHTLVPHAGDARTLGGVEHPFHGEAAWRRWRLVTRDAASCTLEVVLRTTPFVVRRSVTATAAGVEVRQSVTNQSDRDVAFSWTEHPSFGSALIGPGSKLFIDSDPIETYFPRDGASHGGFRTVLAEGRGSAELRNEDTGAAVVLRWDPELFPYLYVWQEHHQTVGFPWWGQVDTIALEPASRGYESDGGALGPIVLAGGASLTASFGLELTAPGRLG